MAVAWRFVETVKHPNPHATQPRVLVMENRQESDSAEYLRAVPFDPSQGSVTIPSVPWVGEHRVLLLCGMTEVAWFYFTVEPGAVLAQPTLAG